MTRRHCFNIAAGVLVGLLAGCSSGTGSPETSPTTSDAGQDGAAASSTDAGSTTVKDATVASDADDDGAASDCDSGLPTSLACTGLYTDIVAKTIAPGVQSFVPAVPLWADGSGKNRWIQLPPGQTIDRSSPNDWVFPPGTKFWKEFSRDGSRVETRFFHKQSDGTWVWVSYVWTADETSATATPNGQSIPLEDGATYTVPSQEQCTQCHSGRAEHIMGFEEVSLGTPGATGLTLAQLAASGLLTPAPTSTSLAIGDDGTGEAAHSLGWIHINCGVPCHNANPTANAVAVGMLLRLDATLLDGGSPESYDPIVTTVGVPSSTGLWGNEDRILPGNPGQSLLVQLISHRGAGAQMPPLASIYVDTPDVAIITDWISKMTPLDGGADAGDAGADDAGEYDAADGISAGDASDAGSEIDASDASAGDASDAGAGDTGDGGSTDAAGED